MKTKVKIETEITITHVHIRVPVRYGEDDIPNDFPLRKGDLWQAKVNIDTGRIEDWPKDRMGEFLLDMKVCDGGTYRLLTYFGDHWDEVAAIEQDYVPEPVPNGYGDYINLKIKDGVIANWPKNPDVSEFFKDDE